MTEPTFVLVKPQLGENIGAVARGLWNFGLTRLSLVSPRDEWPNAAAVATASGAGFVLDNAGVFSDLEEAIGSSNYVFAATARRRSLKKQVMSPFDAMVNAHLMVSSGWKVSIVLGPERSGLTSEDVALASTLIGVPTNPQFGSLNLAQCALLLAYEWSRAKDGKKISEAVIRSVPAESRSKGKFVDLLTEDLERAGYFKPIEKATRMRLNLRNLIMRLNLTQAEIQTLHGIRRSLVKHRGSEETARAKSKEARFGCEWHE